MSAPTTETKRCAFAKCGDQFTPRNVTQKYCSKTCGTSAWNSRPKAERIALRSTKPARFPKARFIYEALEEAEPGMCPWGCEKPLPPRCRTCCRDRECLRYYQRAYRIGRTRVEREIRTPERRELCRCGCGGSFTTRRKPGKHMYLPGHAPSYKKAKRTTFAQAVRKVRAA